MIFHCPLHCFCPPSHLSQQKRERALIMVFARLEPWPFLRDHDINKAPDLTAHSVKSGWLLEFIAHSTNILYSGFKTMSTNIRYADTDKFELVALRVKVSDPQLTHVRRLSKVICGHHCTLQAQICSHTHQKPHAQLWMSGFILSL